MAVASKAQRAVTGVPPARWAQLGKALQEWREDELGYQVRRHFAEDRHINLRLVQDLEKNYRPGTYTKWALQDAARAYEIAPAAARGEIAPSMLAVLHGEARTFVRAESTEDGREAAGPAGFFPRTLPPSPFADPARTAAARPYALAIWERILDLPHRVTDPSASHLGLSGDDAKVWNGNGSLPLGDRAWALADVQRREAGRGRDSEGDVAGA